MTDEQRYRIRQAAIHDGGLQIDWGDGHRSEFHPLWLRHQCECAVCGTPLNAVRALRLHHIPEDIAIASMTYDACQLSVGWSADAHPSRYQARWLRDHCYAESERQRR